MIGKAAWLLWKRPPCIHLKPLKLTIYCARIIRKAGGVYLCGGGAPAVGAAVLQADLPGLGDGRGFVKLHQLVQGHELLRPQEVLALVVPHDFEVLHVALMPERRRRRALA